MNETQKLRALVRQQIAATIDCYIDGNHGRAIADGLRDDAVADVGLALPVDNDDGESLMWTIKGADIDDAIAAADKAAKRVIEARNKAVIERAAGITARIFSEQIEAENLFATDDLLPVSCSRCERAQPFYSFLKCINPETHHCNGMISIEQSPPPDWCPLRAKPVDSEWTSDLPTEDGFYWFKTNVNAVSLARVWDSADGLVHDGAMVDLIGGRSYSLSELPSRNQYQWLGPIKPPESPPPAPTN